MKFNPARKLWLFACQIENGGRSRRTRLRAKIGRRGRCDRLHLSFERRQRPARLISAKDPISNQRVKYKTDPHLKDQQNQRIKREQDHPYHETPEVAFVREPAQQGEYSGDENVEDQSGDAHTIAHLI